MSPDPHAELGESLPRFLSHWIAAFFGHQLMVLLPLVYAWPRVPDSDWPHWWVLLLSASSISLVAAIINANLPVTPRELIKSVALGFTVNATLITLQLA